jgi:hypothetical protein
MVFVLSKNKTPLAPTSEAKARILLKKGKVVVHKVYPLIRLKENKECKKNFEINFDIIVGEGRETYLGKVAVRVSENFNITTTKATIQDINYRYCRTMQKGDGYVYAISTIK